MTRILKPEIEELQSNDFSVDYAERTEWAMPVNDFHEHHEIFFALSDGVRCFVDGELYPVRRGDVFFFPPHVLHRTVALGETVYRRYVISFRENWITGFIPSMAAQLEPVCGPSGQSGLFTHLDEICVNELLDLINAVERCDGTGVFQPEMRKKLAFAQLLLYLFSAFRAAGLSTAPHAGEPNLRVGQIAQYIKENLAEDLSLDALSKRFFIGKSYLCKLFRQTTGYTVNEYVTGLRILKAKALLAENVPVTRVCELSGFGNCSHFSRTFKKLLGDSPKQFAKKV